MVRQLFLGVAIGLSVFSLTVLGYGGEAEVVAVSVKSTADGTYRFDVTVSHGDQGWDHYVDRWEIMAPDGTILGTRTLHHPHVSEQPFTRSLTGIKIPSEIERVTIRAHDTVHAYGGKTAHLTVPRGDL